MKRNRLLIAALAAALTLPATAEPERDRRGPDRPNPELAQRVKAHAEMAKKQSAELKEHMHKMEQRLEHMQVASNHLREAGLEREANMLKERAGQMRKDLHEKATHARKQMVAQQEQLQKAVREHTERAKRGAPVRPEAGRPDAKRP